MSAMLSRGPLHYAILLFELRRVCFHLFNHEINHVGQYEILLLSFEDLDGSPRLTFNDYEDICKEPKEVRAFGAVNSAVGKGDVDVGLSSVAEMFLCSNRIKVSFLLLVLVVMMMVLMLLSRDK